MINTLKGKHWIGIRGQPEGREDRRKPAKGPFRRMQENVAKHGARLREGRETGSDGHAARTVRNDIGLLILTGSGRE